MQEKKDASTLTGDTLPLCSTVGGGLAGVGDGGAAGGDVVVDAGDVGRSTKFIGSLAGGGGYLVQKDGFEFRVGEVCRPFSGSIAQNGVAGCHSP